MKIALETQTKNSSELLIRSQAVEEKLKIANENNVTLDSDLQMASQTIV